MASNWFPMLPPFSTILLCLLFIVFLTFLVSSLETNQTLQVGDGVQKMKMMKEVLHKINKPAEKTIKSSDGDLIDCVLFHKQPAFDHPLLKGKISTEPPEPSFGPNTTREVIENFQSWNANGDGCQKGTIPIRRTTKEKVLRGTSVGRFKMKPMPNSSYANNYDHHEYAAGFLGPGQYYGVKATLNVWAPEVASLSEFSLSQVWVMAGTVGKDLNTLEAGWHVFPSFNGDTRPRLFTYWTGDSYKDTGCYNLQCPGFVQTSNKIVIGGAILPVSSYNGPQYDVTLTIRKDPKDGNWWLLFGHEAKIPVGYWPSALFPLLKEYATLLQFGGEIVDTRPSSAHTTTQMGSGHFPREGFQKAAYVSNLEIPTPTGFQPIPVFNINVENSHCYDLQLKAPNNNFGVHFFFGGPGGSPECP